MSLSRKFVFVLIGSVCSIALLNIVAFYFFYTSYIQIYLWEKIESRQDITIEYINTLIERQTEDELDDIFSDAELEFFELLDLNEGSIPLKEEKNVSIVVDFLVRSGVNAKYIEEVIPENTLQKALWLLQDKKSPESLFVSRLMYSMVGINILILWIFWALWYYFSKWTILPIRRATSQIKSLKFGKDGNIIEYKKKDEIWLLVESINGLNSRLSIQETIRNRLLADISHELKTPITSIQCYLEGISDGVIKLSDKTLGSISAEMNRLIELVNLIMDYEKFENTDLRPVLQSHNVYSFIWAIVETQKPILDEKKQTIELIGSKNIEILFDKDLFTQLVYNLISNFHKYAGESTRLQISIYSERISFWDNGAGVKKIKIPYLFEKFYQGDKEKTWNASKRGIWVWLSIVKRIIEAHSWGYEIDSDHKKWFRFDIKI